MEFSDGAVVRQCTRCNKTSNQQSSSQLLANLLVAIFHVEYRWKLGDAKVPHEFQVLAPSRCGCCWEMRGGGVGM
jgi:hypothetical protein